MIDVHLHVVPPNLPGVGPLHPLLQKPDVELGRQLRLEMEQAGIDYALAMGQWTQDEVDPLGIKHTLQLAQRVPGLGVIGIADPTRTDADHMERVTTLLQTGEVKGLKGYLGYLHFGCDYPGYRPYYELAARFKIPFVFHTGDTYSPLAKLKYAHPLTVDEVAVDFPNVKFILAHCGNPWLMDAAEVVYKNVNVWADLSGLMVGDANSFLDEQRRDGMSDIVADVQRAFRHAERPNRFLFGSDWPLVPMTAYRDFITHIVPEEFHALVFQENARSLFRL